MSYSPTEAAQALAAVQTSRTELVKACDCPPERHAAFAALMTALVACPAAPVVWMFVIEGLILLGVALVMAWDRRRTGMFVNGYRAGRTRWVTFGILAVELSLFGVADYFAQIRDLVWVPLALAVPAFVIAFLGSRYWSQVWKREMEAQA